MIGKSILPVTSNVNEESQNCKEEMRLIFFQLELKALDKLRPTGYKSTFLLDLWWWRLVVSSFCVSLVLGSLEGEVSLNSCQELVQLSPSFN